MNIMFCAGCTHLDEEYCLHYRLRVRSIEPNRCAAKELGPSYKGTAFYLCDGKACDDCHATECKHTSDIRHAKNFSKESSNVYFETDYSSQVARSILNYLDEKEALPNEHERA